MKKKIDIIEVKAIMSDEEIEKKEGSYFPESHYNKKITSNCDVYGILEDGTKKLLVKFRKNVIPQSICKSAYIALEKHAQHRNYNRGAAAGKLKLNKLPAYIGKITKRDSFRIFYKTRDGKKTKDNVGNMAMSNIAGYYDKPDRNEYLKLKKTKKNTTKDMNVTTRKTHKPWIGTGVDMYGIPLCRTTQFTKEEINKWADTVPFIKEADKQFKNTLIKLTYRCLSSDLVYGHAMEMSIWYTMRHHYVCSGHWHNY